jgi:uncharacterized protein YegP (UPF0339 family)
MVNTTKSKFEVFQSPKNKRYYFHLKAVNGEIILASQKYATKQSAEKGIQSIIDNAPNAEIIDLTKSKAA